MASAELTMIAPLDSPLPAVPEGDVLTSAQWTTLLAIADTFVPDIEVSSTHSPDTLALQPSEYEDAVDKIRKAVPNNTGPEAIHKYLGEKASSTPRFRELIQRTFGDYMREDALKGIRVILSALDTRAGCYAFTGYTTSFHLQPVNVRQQILQSWQQSYLPPLRQIVKAFTGLCTATWIKESTTISTILGFPRAPVHGRPGKDFGYDFLQLPPGDEQEIIDTDIVIIGSGCGGGVCAKNLAEAGHCVLVADRAYHFPAKHLPMTSTDAGIHLFHNGGIDTSDDNSVAFVAGQAWGGGGTVNWSASLQTQASVRQEWADEGLPFFTSAEFQSCLDRVCDRMGVSTKSIDHNPNNWVLLEGARKLGYSAKEVPQNTDHDRHYCGYCTLGCGSARKQGPVVSWLPDAAKAGAKFVEGFAANKIAFETVEGKKTAVGVEGIWTSRDEMGGVSGSNRTKRTVKIRAKRVIVSCGTLHSPLLLLRSGLTNPQIGRNLHVHPGKSYLYSSSTSIILYARQAKLSRLAYFLNKTATGVFATFPYSIKPWEGGILTTLCDEFSNLDSHGHGAKIAAMTMLPSWALPFQPWRSGLDFKLQAAKLPSTCGHLAVVRDRDTGRVYPDPVDGRCRIAYTPIIEEGEEEEEEEREGDGEPVYQEWRGGKEIWVTRREIRADHRQRRRADKRREEIHEGKGIGDPAFQAWLRDEVRKRGMEQPETSWGSAHQMGTCRMAGSEKRGVVDPKGKVWGVEGLYVADASVFPSASGVNPMVTNMAISDMISRGVAKDLKGTKV
ncbi:MAG: hypothetical protein LQ343_006852 [Gyalolechia ehrenbergii]|nr:MAG: hypothetical protein LQ343_006852 [Gyalolechia ehrenbergii]